MRHFHDVTTIQTWLRWRVQVLVGCCNPHNNARGVLENRREALSPRASVNAYDVSTGPSTEHPALGCRMSSLPSALRASAARHRIARSHALHCAGTGAGNALFTAFRGTCHVACSCPSHVLPQKCCAVFHFWQLPGNTSPPAPSRRPHTYTHSGTDGVDRCARWPAASVYVPCINRALWNEKAAPHHSSFHRLWPATLLFYAA